MIDAVLQGDDELSKRGTAIMRLIVKRPRVDLRTSPPRFTRREGSFVPCSVFSHDSLVYTKPPDIQGRADIAYLSTVNAKQSILPGVESQNLQYVWVSTCW